MDTLTEAFGTLTRHPGLVWMVLAMICGQFFKTLVFTRERAETPGKLRWFWLAARKTLPWHPVAVGVLIGLFWPGTVEDHYAGGSLAAVVYFAAFGGLSVWAFEALKGVAKRYAKIDLEHRETPVPALAKTPPKLP